MAFQIRRGAVSPETSAADRLLMDNCADKEAAVLSEYKDTTEDEPGVARDVARR